MYVSNAIQKTMKHHDDQFSSFLCILVKWLNALPIKTGISLTNLQTKVDAKK